VIERYLVQYEVRVDTATIVFDLGATFIEVAPVIKGIRSEARTLDRFQKLFRDDRVGIDIGTIQRRNDSGMLGKCLLDN